MNNGNFGPKAPIDNLELLGSDTPELTGTRNITETDLSMHCNAGPRSRSDNLEIFSSINLGLGTCFGDDSLMRLVDGYRRPHDEPRHLLVVTDGEPVFAPGEREQLIESLLPVRHTKFLLDLDGYKFRMDKPARGLFPDLCGSMGQEGGSVDELTAFGPSDIHGLLGHPDGYKGFGESSFFQEMMRYIEKNPTVSLVMVDPDLPAQPVADTTKKD
jgi:hypothetical protein